MALFHTTVLDNQIKALPTVDTASGSIASFNTDLTENLVSVKCQIVAKQASGTPSPDNPLPITTYTGMNVVQMSDITNKKFFEGLLNGTYDYVDLGTLSWGETPTYSVSSGIASTIKILGADVKNNILSNKYETNTGKNIVYNSERGIGIGDAGNVIVSKLSKPSTPTGYLIYELATPKTPTITKAQFETLLSAFSINGTTANIPFGQTVANGVLDITTGKLTITDKIVDFGDLGYYYSNGRFSSTDIPDVKNVSVWNSTLKLCSCYEIAEVQTWTQGDFIIGMYAKNIYVKDSRYTDTISFKQALTGQKFIVELANPITLSIASQDIPTLLGENNIWCDTGDTEVKFLLTVGKKVS